MFEGNERTTFDSADVPLTVDHLPRDGDSSAKATAQDRDEQQAPESFIDWIAKGYLPG